ncbi:hypothetical protein HPB51_027881 [Rhipicephalus microplus]|uniref:Uncharacterized protein n=1 Tax=Rhipicephalus microplus TaxID=6941 RepID=A0A9J6CZ32_RHIMP|nr:hypothetical protein HPB51_027881 [Rhipicephalus microplus]
MKDVTGQNLQVDEFVIEASSGTTCKRHGRTQAENCVAGDAGVDEPPSKPLPPCRSPLPPRPTILRRHRGRIYGCRTRPYGWQAQLHSVVEAAPLQIPAIYERLVHSSATGHVGTAGMRWSENPFVFLLQFLGLLGHLFAEPFDLRVGDAHAPHPATSLIFPCRSSTAHPDHLPLQLSATWASLIPEAVQVAPLQNPVIYERPVHSSATGHGGPVRCMRWSVGSVGYAVV